MNRSHKIFLVVLSALSCAGYTTQALARTETEEKAELIKEILDQFSLIQNLLDQVNTSDVIFKSLKQFISPDAIDYDRLQALSVTKLQTLKEYNSTIESLLKNNTALDKQSLEQFSKIFEKNIVKRRSALGQFLVKVNELADATKLKQIAYRLHPYALLILIVAYSTEEKKIIYEVAEKEGKLKDLRYFGLLGPVKKALTKIGLDGIIKINKDGKRKVTGDNGGYVINDLLKIDTALFKIPVGGYVAAKIGSDMKELYEWTQEKYSNLYEYLTQEYEVQEA